MLALPSETPPSQMISEHPCERPSIFSALLVTVVDTHRCPQGMLALPSETPPGQMISEHPWRSSQHLRRVRKRGVGTIRGTDAGGRAAAKRGVGTQAIVISGPRRLRRVHKRGVGTERWYRSRGVGTQAIVISGPRRCHLRTQATGP
jgi:hypothetical protein